MSSPDKIERCRAIYIKHGGRRHRLIEREMRDHGFTRFNRRVFYARTVNGIRKPGWPEPHEWRQHMSGPRTQTGGPDLNNFHAWLRQTCPRWDWDLRHLKYLYKKLDRITTGKTRRLMIFMPPRHGKSELVTVRYAAWRLQKDPALNIIIGSYGQKLANRFSRKIRNVLSEYQDAAVNTGGNATVKERASSANQNGTLPNGRVSARKPAIPMFPRMRPANTVAEWETRLGGGVRAVGVGAGVTGYGARLVIIDDPVKSRAQAESRTFRDRSWDWFNDDIYTRLEPDAALILIQTRWHEDDLAGRLIKQMADGGEPWDIINLPALAVRSGSEPPALAGGVAPRAKSTFGPNKSVASQALSVTTSLDTVEPRPSADAGGSDPMGRHEGEALWPGRFDIAELERIKRQIGSYSFSALYQQDPAPLDGGLFKREWFRRIIDRAPAALSWCRGYDLAVSTGTSADFTASFRCAKDEKGIIYIADGFRGRLEYPEQRRYVRERMLTEKNTSHGIEKALHGAALVQDMRRDLGVTHRPLISVNIDSDKFTRALAWAAAAEAGDVVLVRGAWIDEFLDEVCRFPFGAHDDQIDAVSIAVRLISQRKGGQLIGMDY